MSLFHEIADFAAHQQVLAGLIGATLTGGLLFWAREAPKKAWAVVQDQLSVTLVVEQDDQMFAHLNIWFARNRIADQVRRLMLQPAYDYEKDCWRWEVTLGRGWHMAWFQGWPLFINREIRDGGEMSKLLGGKGSQRLWIVVPGRKQALIRQLVGAAERIYNDDGRIKVYFWHRGTYRLADCRRPRPIDTVYMPAAQKARILKDVGDFMTGRDRYGRRGTPWRRGYLLEGPPGTGKTSLIFALASVLNKPVYTINLNNVAGDNDLMAALNEVGSDGIAVMEDIDTAEITKERKPAPPEAAAVIPNGVPVVNVEGEQRGVSLSGLLNAIDGVASREGRLLFMTSNHPDQLDSALLRPGRVDVRERLELLGHDEAREMFEAFLPNGDDLLFARTVTPRLPMAAAELQGLLQGLENATPATEPTAAPTPPSSVEVSGGVGRPVRKLRA